MSIESEIYFRLSGFAGLAALVGTRIYPNVAPPDVSYPAVTYRRVSAERPSAMGVDAGIVFARFQFDIWAEDDEAGTAAYDSLRAVAAQLRAALQRWRNSSGTVVQDSFFQSEIELYEEELDLHHAALDFEIIYEE